MKNKFSFLFFVFFITSTLRLLAGFEPAHTKATLVAEKSSIGAGETVWVGVHLKMDPGWHTYWKNPGDSGMATKILWTLPQGFTAGEIQWPWPQKIEMSGLISYGYENEVLLMVPITAPKKLSSHPLIELKARVDWLECQEICLPGRADLSLKLKNIEQNTLVDSSLNPLFDVVRQKIPQNLTDEQIIQQLPSPDHTRFNLWKALLFAFLGGLILNLMPCVLPVLSIKVLSFVKQAQDQYLTRIVQGLLYAGGILISFWVLAFFVIFIQIGGQKLGWGFQLQSPVFVGVMALLFIFLGLNMMGFFEVGTSFIRWADVSGQKKGPWGAFLSGVLATIVATPCTAPFMGSAMGFALTQTAFVSFLVFTFVGLGMAFPYLLLVIFPVFLKFVPKPGPWMETLKKVMGVFLLGTAVWLGWVLYVQIRPAQQASHGLSTEIFSAERVEQLRQQGTPVFIDFTAAWCLTCQVNKKVVFHTQPVIDKFKEKGVVFMVADWTHRDENITKALNGYGRNGVPLYVLYDRSPQAQPQLLPEILTPSLLIRELEKIKP